MNTGDRTPAAPLPVPAGRPRGRVREGQARAGVQERHRATNPSSRAPGPGDAGRIGRRGAGAGRRLLTQLRQTRPESARMRSTSVKVDKARSSAGWWCRATAGTQRSSLKRRIRNMAQYGVARVDDEAVACGNPVRGGCGTEPMVTTAALIHLTAVVDPSARSAARRVGAYLIGAEVEIGDDTRDRPALRDRGPDQARPRQRLPVRRDRRRAAGKKFRGERVLLVIGDGNSIREFVTINRGTGDGGGITRIGHRNWIILACHVAHDCTSATTCSPTTARWPATSPSATGDPRLHRRAPVLPDRRPRPSSAWARSSTATCRRS